MGRVFIALCYVWASIVDQHAGAFWQIGGGNDTGYGMDDSVDGYNKSSSNSSDSTAGGTERSFEWWSFRAFWEGGRYGERSEKPTNADPVDEEAGWFSQPERKGRMHSEAGWAGYFVDGFGLHLFGEWWPGVAYTTLLLVGIGLGGLTAYVLQTLCTPVRWVLGGLATILGFFACCCRRGDGGGEVPALAAPNLARTIEWHGPATGWNTETRYLQERIKGRGSRRKLNDIIVRCDGQVARLQQDESRLKRIDAYGLRVQFAGIAGCSSRAFRRKLEDVGEVHLCRRDECGLDHGLHVREFAGLDHETILDVHEYTSGGSCWLLRASWRGIYWTLGIIWYMATFACRGCYRNREVRKQTKADGSTRILHPDSESEVEAEDNTCEGVRVGILVDGQMRPLAPHGCNDLGCGEDTILLDEDTAVSDVRMPGPGQNARVSLCMHHRQVYQTASAKRKCGVLTCYRAAKAARHGVPLCFEHMDEHEANSGRRNSSPHPNGLFTTLRRRFNRGGSRGRGRSSDPRGVPDEPGGRAQGEAGGDLREGPRQLEAAAEERGSEAVMKTPRARTVDLGKVAIPSPPKSPGEERLEGRKVWVKFNIQDGSGRSWVQFMGTVIGMSLGQVRGDLRWTTRIEALGQDVELDPAALERNILNDEGYIARVLKDIPTEAESLGRDIHGYMIEEEHSERMLAWSGRYVAGGRRISEITLDVLKHDLRGQVRRHAQGYVKGETWPALPAESDLGLDRRVKSEATATEKPKPARRARSRSHSLGKVMQELDEENIVDGDPQETESMIETFEVARNSGQTFADAIATLAVVDETDEEDVIQKLRQYVRGRVGKKDGRHTGVCLEILRHVHEEKRGNTQPAEEVRKQANKGEGLDPPREEARTPFNQPFAPPPGLGARPAAGGPAIRSLEGDSGRNPLLGNEGLVSQLFGGPEVTRGEEARRTVEDLFGDSTVRAGAATVEDPEVGARMMHVLEGIRKATEGEKKNTPGTRSALGAEEGLDMYLARGCNTLKVEVLPDATGKELFDGLKRACGHSKALLQGIGWPCLVSNGIAYGLASLCHGGRDHTTLPGWSLSVAQAVTAKPKDFDGYEMPKDDKVEPKPRHPTHFATWVRQAKNEISMIGSVMGLEHKVDRLKALDQLEKAHEADPEAWPESYCFSLCEELKAAWVEELREERRKLCKILNTDQPRKEDLKFVALAPGSGFRFPNTFRLDDPTSYYQTVCVPRQSRAIKSIIYSQLHQKRHAPKVGETEDGGQDEDDSSRIGRAIPKKGAIKPDKPAAKAYPAGKGLRTKEAGDSVKHAPKTKEGKPICWDAACHSGCQRSGCSHAHVPVNATKGLHWTVIAQFIRRGGLKNGPVIQPNQVDGRIAQLRTQARQEQAEKVQDGAKQGWLPPDGYEVPEEFAETQYTELEEGLRELTRGPEYTWLEDQHGRTEKLWEETPQHPEAVKRAAKLKELEDAGVFAGVGSMSEYLQSHVRGRILNEALEGKELGVEAVLLEATEQGARELAEEARSALEKGGHQVGSEDRPHSAWIGGPVWQKEHGHGAGRFQFICGDESYDWEYIDYKDQLPAAKEVAGGLGLAVGEVETRQCLVLHPAAGVLLWGQEDWPPAKPTLAEVQETAQGLRRQLWDHGAEALSELGEAAPWIGSREAEVRSYAHDCTRAHHDKDYRLYHAFNVEELQEYTMQCWRVNSYGQYQVDHIIGSKPGAEHKVIPFLIHGGHIRLLVPDDKEAGSRLAARLTMLGKADKEWMTVGWREILANEDPAAPLVPGKRPKCTRCQDQGEDRVGKETPQVPWAFIEIDTNEQKEIIDHNGGPLCRRPEFCYGIIGQEVFAGAAQWTKAMREAGITTCEPVEVFEDPLNQKGRKPEHDLLNPEIRERYLREARALPGPDVPNVYHFGTPCTSYCDYALLNGGSRSFEQPEGIPGQQTQQEVEGNIFAEFTADLCETAYEHGKEFVLESSMPTGRYPKLWDQECIRRLRRKTGARIVPTHLCQWGLGPSDDKSSRYKKGQWNLVSPGLYVYALLLARRCQGGHSHTQLKGGVAGASYPRTREAQVYPPALCEAWALAIRGAYYAWGPQKLVPKLRAILSNISKGGHEGNGKSAAAPPVKFDTSGITRKCGGDDEAAGGADAEGGPEAEAAEEADAEADGAGAGAQDDAEGAAVEADGAGDETGSSWEHSIQGERNGPHMWTLWPPRRIRPPQGATEDVWDYIGDTGRLIRHHVTRRYDTFGNRPEDWNGSPVRPGHINGIRRTTMHTDIGSQVLVDDWREWYGQGAQVQQHPWTGHTEFIVLGDASGGEEGAPEERPEEDPEPEDDPNDEEGEESELYEEEVESEDIFEVSTQAPPSDDRVTPSRSRSRSRNPRGGATEGEDRRVGYAEDYHRLVRLEEGGQAQKDVDQAAEDYVAWCAGEAAYSKGRVKEAVAKGDTLLRTAGGIEDAMTALWKARTRLLGEPLEGALSSEVKEATSENHYSYLASMVKDGVPSRREYERKRVEADPYPSALEHIEELYEKTWKDARFGIVLLCSNESEEYTPDLVECPQGRVPKQLPDRSISKEGRPIHAMLVANAATHKYHHPPALQPRHRQVARKAVWWKARHPNISCAVAKLDVSRAFKWHSIQPRDCGDFGSSLPGDCVGVEGKVRMIYGGMPFGWCGAPGEYMIFALAGRAVHESYRPRDGEVNGPTAFSSEWLMDDSVSVEPLLGVRPWQAVDCLGHAIVRIWGEEALNMSKQEVEGSPSPSQIVWGLHMDCQSMTCRLPEAKALKMRYLLALPELQWGGRRVRLRTARELRGLAQYASIVMPQLRPELPVLDALLSESHSDGGYAYPGGSEQEQRASWHAWDETVELFRVWFETPSDGSFEGAFTDMLSARELLALPGQAGTLRWIGGDATLEVIGALDWKNRRYMRESAKEILEVLQHAPELDGEEVKIKIALAELVCYVGFAAAEAHQWGGNTVAYATDNMNVRAWLTSRKARCPLARHLLRILGMLESRWSFRTLSYYIRTYHNLTADWISRESREVVESELKEKGWVKVAPAEGWGLYLVDALKGVFRWPGDRGGAGLQVKGNREGERIYRAVEGHGVGIELGGGWRPWGYAWKRLGGDLCRLADGVEPQWGALDTSVTYGSRLWQGEEVVWLFASVGQDLWLKTRRSVCEAVDRCKPGGLVVDLPYTGPRDGLVMELRDRDYNVMSWKVRCTDYGDAVAKVKWIVVAMRGRPDVGEWQVPAATVAEPNGIDKAVRSCGRRGPWLDDDWEVCLSRRISTSGEKTLPWPAGHYWPRGEKSKKRLIYDIRGPSLTPKKDEAMVVADLHAGEANKGVRRLSADEEWLVNGGTQEASTMVRQAGGNDGDIKGEVLRSMPQKTAHCLMGWIERGRQDGLQGKVGVCSDRDRVEADRVIESWLRSWRSCPAGPRRGFEDESRLRRLADESVEPSHLVGGRPRKPRAKSAPPSADVIPLALGRSRERLVINANLALEKEKSWLDAMAAEAIMAKLSEGSKVGYEIGWRQWCLWRRVEGKSVYLVGEGRDAKKERTSSFAT